MPEVTSIPARIAAAILAAAIPGLAFAHGSVGGLSGLYAGMLHPVAAPAHLLGAIALGVLSGKGGQAGTARALSAIVLGCLLGMLLSRPGFAITVQLMLLPAIALVGILIAANLEVPRSAAALLCFATAFAIIMDSAPDAASGAERLATLAGTALSISAAFVWISAIVACLRRPWHRIGVRIAGSWISACALLVLALVVSAHPLVRGSM
jgi:urease accessory protein